jgi:hypothetical protein
MLYVGVDVGGSKCGALMMSLEGKIVKDFGFCNNSNGISGFTSLLLMDDHVVMVSTGSFWLGSVQSFR